MKNKPYLPAREAERVVWLNNFAAKFGTYATTFGFVAADTTAIANMAAFYSYIINLIDQSRTFTKQLTAFKDVLSVAPAGTTLGSIPTLTPGAAPTITPAGIFTIIGGYVQRIKGNTAKYTEAIGQDLGIIGEETSFDADNFVPEFAAKAIPGSVTLSFKKGHLDGVNVYSHPVGGDPAVWEKLAFDGHSPYHDTRPLLNAGKPELRHYRLRGVLHDQEIGQWSDVVSITFTD